MEPGIFCIFSTSLRSIFQLARIATSRILFKLNGESGAENGADTTGGRSNPARSIGIFDEVGSLTPGKRADIVLADEELNIVKVL